MAALGGPILVTVGTFEMRRGSQGPKVTTVTRIATWRGPIPVTVGAFEMRRGSEGRKMATVTRIATQGEDILTRL